MLLSITRVEEGTGGGMSKVRLTKKRNFHVFSNALGQFIMMVVFPSIRDFFALYRSEPVCLPHLTSSVMIRSCKTSDL